MRPSRILGSWLCLAAMASPAAAENLVPNPGFEAGNVGFTSAYAYQHYVFPNGGYFIGADPSRYNPNWSNGARPHSGAAMMIIDGAGQPGVQVWATAPLAVRPKTTYFFSFYVTSVHPVSPAILSFSINGEQIGRDFSPTANVGAWIEACVPWNSGSSRSASIAIVNENTTYYGNDFALDDIWFDADQPCENEPLVDAGGRFATLAARGG